MSCLAGHGAIGARPKHEVEALSGLLRGQTWAAGRPKMCGRRRKQVIDTKARHTNIPHPTWQGPDPAGFPGGVKQTAATCWSHPRTTQIRLTYGFGVLDEGCYAPRPRPSRWPRAPLRNMYRKVSRAPASICAGGQWGSDLGPQLPSTSKRAKAPEVAFGRTPLGPPPPKNRETRRPADGIPNGQPWERPHGRALLGFRPLRRESQRAGNDSVRCRSRNLMIEVRIRTISMSCGPWSPPIRSLLAFFSDRGRTRTQRVDDFLLTRETRRFHRAGRLYVFFASELPGGTTEL